MVDGEEKKKRRGRGCRRGSTAVSRAHERTQLGTYEGGGNLLVGLACLSATHRTPTPRIKRCAHPCCLAVRADAVSLRSSYAATGHGAVYRYLQQPPADGEDVRAFVHSMYRRHARLRRLDDLVTCPPIPRCRHDSYRHAAITNAQQHRWSAAFCTVSNTELSSARSLPLAPTRPTLLSSTLLHVPPSCWTMPSPPPGPDRSKRSRE